MKKLLLISLLTAFVLAAQTPVAITPASTGTSDTFQNYAKVNPAVPDAGADQEVEVPNTLYIPKPAAANAAKTAPATVTAPASTMYIQTTNGTLPAAITANYVGLGNGFNGWTIQGLYPSDTTLGVGNGQILQWVNLRLTILNKSTGVPLLGGSGYVQANQIWSGFTATSICRTQNNGDPSVQYDRLANRWILHQFAFNSTKTQNAMCFAVSQTNDSTGAYNLYEYDFPNSLPDYPKIGVWPDAYYMTANNFTYPGGSYSGSQVCAFNRAAMIAGTAANGVCFTAGSSSDGEWFAAVPGDFEGTLAPPANTTAYIVNGDWFSLNFPPYSLRIRRFHPDFVIPANSTLDDGFGGGPGSFVQLPFATNVVGACGDNGGICVQQPGTAQLLDTLSMRPMYRLAYRNLGANRESLVVTESIGKLGSANFAGIQLVEIRNPGANPPSIYNNVNFNPDTTNRWMGAAATDKLGNIGIGYSVGSSTLSPGIRIAGRLRNDIKSTVRGEMVVQTGAGNQTGSASRWGDYSTMQIDPDDDCTFWFTTEYTNSTSAANWATRIISFRFNSCQ
jgi:hypothetical protein